MTVLNEPPSVPFDLKSLINRAKLGLMSVKQNNRKIGTINTEYATTDIPEPQCALLTDRPQTSKKTSKKQMLSVAFSMSKPKTNDADTDRLKRSASRSKSKKRNFKMKIPVDGDVQTEGKLKHSFGLFMKRQGSKTERDLKDAHVSSNLQNPSSLRIKHGKMKSRKKHMNALTGKEKDNAPYRKKKLSSNDASIRNAAQTSKAESYNIMKPQNSATKIGNSSLDSKNLIHFYSDASTVQNNIQTSTDPSSKNNIPSSVSVSNFIKISTLENQLHSKHQKPTAISSSHPSNSSNNQPRPPNDHSTESEHSSPSLPPRPISSLFPTLPLSPRNHLVVQSRECGVGTLACGNGPIAVEGSPLKIKRNRASGESVPPIPPNIVNSKTLEEKFKRFTQEIENNWCEFIKYLDVVEGDGSNEGKKSSLERDKRKVIGGNASIDGAAAPGESFMKRVQDYKRRAERCLRVVRAANIGKPLEEGSQDLTLVREQSSSVHRPISEVITNRLPDTHKILFSEKQDHSSHGMNLTNEKPDSIDKGIDLLKKLRPPKPYLTLQETNLLEVNQAQELLSNKDPVPRPKEPQLSRCPPKMVFPTAAPLSQGSPQEAKPTASLRSSSPSPITKPSCRKYDTEIWKPSYQLFTAKSPKISFQGNHSLPHSEAGTTPQNRLLASIEQPKKSTCARSKTVQVEDEVGANREQEVQLVGSAGPLGIRAGSVKNGGGNSVFASDRQMLEGNSRRNSNSGTSGIGGGNYQTYGVNSANGEDTSLIHKSPVLNARQNSLCERFNSEEQLPSNINPMMPLKNQSSLPHISAADEVVSEKLGSDAISELLNAENSDKIDLLIDSIYPNPNIIVQEKGRITHFNKQALTNDDAVSIHEQKSEAAAVIKHSKSERQFKVNQKEYICPDEPGKVQGNQERKLDTNLTSEKYQRHHQHKIINNVFSNDKPHETKQLKLLTPKELFQKKSQQEELTPVAQTTTACLFNNAFKQNVQGEKCEEKGIISLPELSEEKQHENPEEKANSEIPNLEIAEEDYNEILGIKNEPEKQSIDQLYPDEEVDCSVLFATTQEKADIISSFILENLIVEALSEDHCLFKFISILGRHGRRLEKETLEKYLVSLIDMVREDAVETEAVTRRLNTPIGQSDLQRLLLASPRLTEADIESIGGFLYEPILDIKLYVMLEEKLRETDYTLRELDQTQIEREHIIHKMIFDSYNENLDYKRIYGIMGPMPSYLSNFNKEPEYPIRKAMSILDVAKDEVVEWGTTYAGRLIAKEPFLNHAGDHEEIDRLREKSMEKIVKQYVSLLLSQRSTIDLKWSSCHEEFLECFLMLSEHALDYLVDEVVRDCSILALSRHNLTAK